MKSEDFCEPPLSSTSGAALTFGWGVWGACFLLLCRVCVLVYVGVLKLGACKFAGIHPGNEFLGVECVMSGCVAIDF